MFVPIIPAVSRIRSSLLLGALVAAMSGCAMHRVAPRPPLAQPLPLRVAVCPGEFNDYARDGRDLLAALRERNLFHEVAPIGALSGPADLVLAPELGDLRSRPMLGVVTLVPWIATATVFPWFVRSDREVRIRVLAPSDSAPCGRRAEMTTISTGLVSQTQVMIGWTAPLVALLPRWETKTNHEFRPAIDSLVARRDWLMEIAGRKR